MIDVILVTIAFAILLIGTFTDFKVREVPDWVNYSGIVLGLGIRSLYSAYSWDYSYILAGLLGFGVFLLIALGMFYLGQWGGGDSKMLMGLGALIGLEFRPDGLLIAFFVNMLFIGAAFGVIWGIYLAAKHRGKFMGYANKVVKSKEYKRAKLILFIVAGALVIASFAVEYFTAVALITAALVLFVIFYSWLFLTSVEKTSLIKSIPVEKLTEGDWIVKDVVIGKKRICGPKDLGISKTQINKLLKLKQQGKIRKILIKEGMPFVPVFLVSMVVSVVWGNLVLLFI
jgi:prepilin signal peptidase PulO-like enzyme (type II secretory pathway)